MTTWGLSTAALAFGAWVVSSAPTRKPPQDETSFSTVMSQQLAPVKVFEQLFDAVRTRHPTLRGDAEASFDARVFAALRVRQQVEPDRQRRAEVALVGSPVPDPSPAALAADAPLEALVAEAQRQLEAERSPPLPADVLELSEQWLGAPAASTHVSDDALRERFELLLDAMVDALEDPFTQVIHARALGRAAMAELLGVPSATGLLASPPDADGGFSLDLVLRGSDPALKGARKGDTLLAVDGRAVAGLPRWQVQEWLALPCRITLSRPGFPQPLELDVANYSPAAGATRRALLEGDIGYLSFPLFRAGAFLELREAVRDLTARGARAIVLDLRGNPGGLIVEAGTIANLFIDAGKTVIATTARLPSDELHLSTGRAAFPDLPLVVLQDGSSASASEILAASFQDHRRALLVGETSYGKGIGQLGMTLPYKLPGNDSIVPSMEMLSLTVLEARSPLGRNWHGKGIAVDLRASAAPDTPERFAARQLCFDSKLLREAIAALRLTAEEIAQLRVPGPAPTRLVAVAKDSQIACTTTDEQESLKEVARWLHLDAAAELAACPDFDPPLVKAIRAARMGMKRGE